MWTRRLVLASLRPQGLPLPFVRHQFLLCQQPGRRRRPGNLSSHPPLYLAWRTVVTVNELPDPPLDDPPLVTLKEVSLSYPATTTKNHKTASLGPLDLSLYPPTHGGHVLLGRNGVGKSLLCNAIASHATTSMGKTSSSSPSVKEVNPYVMSGSIYSDHLIHRTSIATVSFESHQELLLDKTLTVSKAISKGGKLSKAAQFLIVRFSLFHLLHRTLATVSTGEIRKVMIIRALSDRPKLLILDNAFDGLDVTSRDTLQTLVSNIIQGFRPDVLVQEVSAKATAHTQVLLLTHRGEEIVPEIAWISQFLVEMPSLSQQDKQDHTSSLSGPLVTSPREDRSGIQLLHQALGMDSSSLSLSSWERNTTLPCESSIATMWYQGTPASSSVIKNAGTDQPLIELHQLCLQRGEAMLLQDLTWTVRVGERWLVAGGNGAGKSTLSRLVANFHTAKDEAKDQGVTSGTIKIDHPKDAETPLRGNIGWVSTERHVLEAKSMHSVQEIMLCNGTVDEGTAKTVLSWLDLDPKTVWSTPFAHLSQGQQKLILIASALASRPRLLVLDEPCQGLDLIHRNNVLGLVERICRATDLSLIYITHHLEEVLPSIDHVLHLHGGKSVYQGLRKDYDPSKV